MKITHIHTKHFKAPLKTPFITALRRVDMLEDVIVVIECDDGTEGYGEGAPAMAVTGESLNSIIFAIDYLKPHLIGRDIEEFDTLLHLIHTTIAYNNTAKSALEIALYDLKAKASKLPLYQMLGGMRTDFRTDITISMDETEKMVADAQHAVALGYNALKIKIGDNLHKDKERIEAIYHAVDKHIKLRLDANQAWSAKESVALLLSLEKEGIVVECIEQPVAAHDIEGLRYIKERVQTPLLADESIFSLRDARQLLQMQAIDYVNIKLAKTAGISKALKLADLAKEYGVKCMMGCMLEGPIAIVAGLHVASAKADTITMLDLDAVNLLRSNPIETYVDFNESHLVLSDSYGLGVMYA